MYPASKILIVDDDPNARTMVASLLAEEGYELIFTADGPEGLAQAAARLPDVILLDVIMPGLDGFEVCRRLRANDQLAEVPILMLTVLSDNASRLLGLQAGVDDFLSKPFERDEMLARLRVITRLGRYRHLLEERHKFQQFIEYTSDGIVLCDEDSVVTEWNAAMEAISGVRRAEALGRPLWEILAPVDVAPNQSLFSESPAIGQALESPFRRPDGAHRILEISAFLIPSATGFRLGAIVRDLTERKRAQEVLAQEQHRMQALMDTIPDAIYFKDRQSRFIRINRALADQFGLSHPDEAIGRTDLDFFTAEHAQAAYDDDQRIIETGEPLINLEEKETWPDRPPTWVSTTKMPLRDPTGAITGLFGISRDITARKQAGAALIESEERFRATFEQAAVGIAHVSLEGRLLRVNQRLCDIVGYSREELQTKTFQDLTHPEEPGPDEAVVRQLVSGQLTTVSTEKRCVRKPRPELGEQTGATVWINHTVAVARDPAGTPLHFISVIEDISRRKQMEAELVNSEKRFRALIENSTDGIELIGADGRILYQSPAAARILGFLVDSRLGHPFFELIQPDDLPASLAQWRQLLADPAGSTHGHYRLRHQNGEWRWIEFTAANLLAEPSVQAIVLNYRDITERRQAELENERLYQAERQQRQLAETLIDVGAVLVAESNLDALIQRVLDLVNRAVPNDTANIMLLEADRPRLAYVRRPQHVEAETYLARLNFSIQTLPNLQHMAETGQPVIVADTHVDPQWVSRPETDWIRAYAGAPIRAGGKLVGFLNVNSATPGQFGPDQTRWLQAFADQAAIAIHNAQLFAESQRRADGQTILSRVALSAAAGEAFDATVAQATADLRRLWPEASLGFLFVDKIGAELHVHPSYHGLPTKTRETIPLGRGLLGWVMKEQKPVRVDNVLEDPRYIPRLPETRTEMIAPLVVGDADRRRTIGVINVESSQVAAFLEDDMRLLTTLASQLALLFEKARLDRELAAHAATLEERVKERTLQLEAMNSELQQAKREADRANQAKSEFLSRMSHELRTPLNAILGFAQIMEMDDLGGDADDNVKQISRAGQHLLTLINEVLDIARVEAGRLSIALESVPVDQIVREALDLVQPLAAKRQILLQADRPPANWQVQADPQRLKQVLLNLLSNAIKYNREGGTVTVEIQRGAAAAGLEAGLPAARLPIRFSVHDTGPGIHPDKLPRLFTPFDRLGAEQTDVPGTGLGLAFSKNLVEAMQGMMGVESQPGQGSTFWVELPAAAVLTTSVESETIPVGVLSPSPEAIQTVLYIEDNLQNRTLVEKIFARRGATRLITSMQGQLGLDLAREHHPDVILLDLHLPDLPGDQILQALQADERTQNIPVIMVSADALPGQIDRLLKGGARAYLTKPIDVRRFLQIIDEILGKPG